MIRPEFVHRKLQLIADDLGRLVRFKDETLESLTGDDVKLAAVERMLERIVMRAVDINEHVVSELATGDERSSRLSYRDTFLMLAGHGVYPKEFAERIANSAGLRNILVHDYNDLDRRIVHASIRTCLRDYHRYLEHLAEFLQRKLAVLRAAVRKDFPTGDIGQMLADIERGYSNGPQA